MKPVYVIEEDYDDEPACEPVAAAMPQERENLLPPAGVAPKWACCCRKWREGCVLS